ncbi:MAG: exo-beta-1,3-glucanase (GH17 family) [Myxococcota bacterium]
MGFGVVVATVIGMLFAKIPVQVLLLGAMLFACAKKPVPPVLGDAPGREEPLVRRGFSPEVGGEAVLAGISYGPFREGQRPGGPEPTAEQILEDLQIIAERWHLLRFYSSQGPAETILRTIRDEQLPIVVMVGAWIAPDAPESNAAEVASAIRLARAYPEQVAAVSVGNESQVFWSGHRSPPEVLISHIRTVRAGIEQPVTTADDYNFWNKPESHDVAREVDFLLLHAYAMWNQQPLDEAVPWTAATVSSIQAEHPELVVVIGETGWATELNPEGSEVQYIKAPAGEAEQATFYAGFTAWAAEAGVPYFYFEAFDEPWKGSDDPREVEKHWGLFEVDRTPKPALEGPQ